MPKKNRILLIFNSWKKKILLSIWILSSVITFILGGGFATRYVSELAEDEFIRYREELISIKSIDVLNKEDGHLISICFNALLAYTPENNDYQVTKFLETDFTGWATRYVSREQIKVGCNKVEGSTDLLADAKSAKVNNDKPYYKLNGIYCLPGKDSGMLTLGCFVYPKQERGRIQIALTKPEYRYVDNSNYLSLLPIAWIVDVLLAPIFVVFYASYFLLWVTGGGVPGMP